MADDELRERDKSSFGLLLRLSGMMALQFAVWGAWLPLLYPFLTKFRGMTDDQVGLIFAVGGIGAILGPFIAGQIADRYFPTQWYLGLSHLVGALFVWQLHWIDTYYAFLLISLIYSVIYSPTLALTTSLSFHNLADREREFGKVRLWGTVGWIVVGIAVGQWLLFNSTPEDPVAFAAQRLTSQESIDLSRVAAEGKRSDLEAWLGSLASGVPSSSEIASLKAGELLSSAYVDTQVQYEQYSGVRFTFKLSAVLGILLGLYCFLFLPHTPPSRGAQSNATFEAISELRARPLLVLFLLAVPMSCVHQFYFVHAAGFLGTFQSKTASAINSIFGVGGGGLMTIGQVAEIGVISAMPFLLPRVRRKTMLSIGLTAYIVRMLLFSQAENWASALGISPIPFCIAGVLLHGACFGAFLFVAFIVVDELTSPDVRASAQNLFNLVIFGFGITIGSPLSTAVAAWAKGEKGLDYERLFAAPMLIAIICWVLFQLFYPKVSRPEPNPEEASL